MTEQPFHVELKKSRRVVAQKWRFRALSRNGRILVHSESYHNYLDALDAISLLFGDDVDLREQP